MRMTFSTCALVLVAGCPEKEDYTKQKPVEEEAAAKPAADRPPPPPPKKGPPADLGKCDLKVTGGITAEQSSPGGKTATNISYWFLPEERKNMMGVDGYVVNCHGDKLKLTILPSGGKPDLMPFAPKTFTLAKGKSDGAGVNVQFGQATLADPNGTIAITALDKRHIAGTIDISGKVVPGNKQVKITGSFDLICPGYSACEFE